MRLYFRGEPKAVQGFRFTRSGKKYQPTKIMIWKALIRCQAKSQLPAGWVALSGPVAISLTFVFPLLKSFKKSDIEFIKSGGKIYKTTKPDLPDNLAKGLIDALSGLLWEKDQQICKEYGREKIYGMEAMTIVDFEQINDRELHGNQDEFDFEDSK